MKRNFFHRILITYSLIICLLLVCVFSIFILYIQRDQQRQIDSYNNESFTSYAKSYENVFDSFYYIAQNIKANRALDLFAFSSKGDYYSKMTALHRDLSDYNSLINSLVTTGGYDIWVHKSTDDTVITSQNTTRLATVLDDLGIPAGVYKEIVTGLGRGRESHEAYIFTDNNIMYVTQKDYVDAKIIIAIYTDVGSLNLYPLDPEMRVGVNILDRKVVDLRTPVAHPVFARGEELGALRSLREQRVEGVRYHWFPSAYLDLVYYYHVDDSLTAGETASLIGQMVLLLVLSCSVAFAIIAMFSVRLYKPVERLLNTFLSLDVNDNRSDAFQSEIDFMAQSALQIRNQNRELVQTLEQNTRELKADLIESILQDSIPLESALGELERYGLEWMDGRTAPVLFDLTDLRGEAHTQQDGVADSIVQILQEQIEARCEAVKYLDYSGRLCFIIRQPDMAKLGEHLQEIITAIDTALGLLVCAYVGPVSESLSGLRGSYVAAHRIVENRHRIPYKNVYGYRDYQKLPAETVVYPIHNEMKLLEAVERSDSREVHRLLDYLFREYVEKAFSSKESRDLILFALVNTINRAQQNMGVAMEQVADQEQYVYLELRMCESSEAMQQYVATLFDKILLAVRSNSEQQSENLRERLREYIQNHLQQDISLLDLAEHFNLSPNYMSSLFKATMDDNFKEYLSRARFDRAVELLRQDPSLKMNSLCDMVGLNHPNTLIRLFKKYSGRSPVQYVKEFIVTE